VPKGLAHGFITLTANVTLEYLVSANYDADSELGFRYDDRYFNLPWPREVEVISAKDRAWPDFNPTSDPLTGGSP
jgi:dTDP-4-dehydrorhamnose 3,5-epimerase